MSSEKTSRRTVKRPIHAGRVAPIHGLIPLVVGLVLWQVIARDGSGYFPPPSAWVEALVGLWVSGQLGGAILNTLGSFLIALVVSSVLGAVLGIALGRSRTIDRLLGPAFEFARTMPSGALVPVAVLLIGYTESMKLLVVVATAIWPVLLATRTGARQLSPERLEVARMLRLGRWSSFRKITLPSLTPSIILGVQIAAPIVLIIVLVVEVITQVSGLGREMALAQGTFHSAAVYGVVALTGILGLIVNGAVGGLARVIKRFDV